MKILEKTNNNVWKVTIQKVERVYSIFLPYLIHFQNTLNYTQIKRQIQQLF